MTSIDAWVEDWEVGCCRSVPSPGERWSAVLVFSGGLAPSAARQLERLASGAVRLAGPVVERFVGSGQAMAILQCGQVHVVVHDPPEGDGFEGEGRLYEDNHFDYMDEAGFESWRTSGTVRRLWVVPGPAGDEEDWPGVDGELLRGDPKEVSSIDPRWVGPLHWEARVEVELDE